MQQTPDEAYESLAVDRKLLSPASLQSWGLAVSIGSNEWVVPGYTPDRKMVQLYKYHPAGQNGRMVLMATPGDERTFDPRHQLFGMNLFNPDCPTTYLCEGLWDGVALWESLRSAKDQGRGKLAVTGSPQASLLSSSNVVAVPSCTVFYPSWVKPFSGKDLSFLFDNDYPRPHPTTGQEVGLQGLRGVQRACAVITGCSERPTTVRYLCWGPGGYIPDFPDRFDVRDWLARAGGMSQRVSLVLPLLLAKVQPIPDEWSYGKGKVSRNGSMELECLPCTEWKDLINSWRKALTWIDGLDRALAFMIAVSVTTESVGDQLWGKVVGPPSCGKSVLCEAISVCRKYVLPKDTFTGLFSGYQVDRQGSENMSLALRMSGKTLVIKDGDTVLQLPNRDQVLSQFRGLYDRAVRTSYGNKMSKDYEGLNATVIICGTESLRQLDSSELGERMIDCVIAEEMEAELEDEIALRKAYQAEQEVSLRSDGHPGTRDNPELVEAKQLTGGYLQYLRDNAQEFLSRVKMSEDCLRQCVSYGTFVAYMRSRPSKRQSETTQRELSFRLVSQHVRLAKALAVVLNRKEVDQEVMSRVARVAQDTSRGRTLKLVQWIFGVGEGGAETASLAAWTGETNEAELSLLKHLRRIKAVEYFKPKVAPGMPTKGRWRLSARVQRLYGECIIDSQRENGIPMPREAGV